MSRRVMRFPTPTHPLWTLEEIAVSSSEKYEALDESRGGGGGGTLSVVKQPIGVVSNSDGSRSVANILFGFRNPP
jgi:hypothetical protein